MGEIMKIVGCGKVKKLAVLVPGELVTMQARGEPSWAICVKNDGRVTEVVLLSGPERSIGWKASPERSRDCYSYGNDWVLDFSNNVDACPGQIPEAPEPRFILDENGLKLSYVAGQYEGVGFWDCDTQEMADRWPMSAVALSNYTIWQDEDAMNRPGAKPLFVKEAPAASDQGLTP